MKTSAIKLLVAGILFLSFFAGGALFHKYRFFPYTLLRDTAKRIKASVVSDRALTNASIRAQLSHDTATPPVSQNIESGLLPLHLAGVRFAAHYDLPKSAGGITIVNDTVIVIDRLGGIYSHREGAPRKCEFPPLPNNLAAYITDSPIPLAPDNFRVHDIDYSAPTQMLVVSHEYYDRSSGMPRLAISTIHIDPEEIRPTGTWHIVFLGDPLDIQTLKSYPGLGGGGRLLSQPSGKLIFTAGDYVQDGVSLHTDRLAQDPEKTFGKIIELDLQTKQKRILTSGHRNPQGLLATPDGRLYATEHGQAGGDELNLLREGVDYGWPTVTLGVNYGTYSWPHAQYSGEHNGFQAPMFAWIPSIGVSNLIQVRGFHRRWDGDFLVASLKAMSLFRLRIDGDRVVYSEPIWIGERIRDVAQRRDGTIVLWTDDAKLLYLTVDLATLKGNVRTPEISPPSTMAACMGCHHFGPTNPTHPAPTLSNLAGRRIAADNFSRYSDALKKTDGIWTTETLRAFITNPNHFATGTLMPKIELSADAIEEIVALLVSPAPERN